MENNWPETIEELLAECQMLVGKTDLYELGERGEPFTGEVEPRVDGTDYLAGEYRYGVAMIPAQWVTHVLEAATLGEQIIRCRDCRHATISTTGVCKYCEMFVLPDVDGYGADPQVNLPLDFFCGFAERKEVDE